jgi:hypothetical protein
MASALSYLTTLKNIDSPKLLLAFLLHIVGDVAFRLVHSVSLSLSPSNLGAEALICGLIVVARNIARYLPIYRLGNIAPGLLTILTNSDEHLG